MANFEIDEDQAALIRELRKLETSDPVHANVYNALFEKLINNDAFLERLANKMIEKSMLCHVLDSVNAQQVLAADVGPKITAIIDGLQEDVNGLNTNLNNRAGLILCGSAPANDANLLFVENRITFFETIVSTLNTPYKANLTQGLTAGIAITYMSAPGFGIQLHLSTGAPDNNTGAPKAFMRAYSNYIMGAWH